MPLRFTEPTLRPTLLPLCFPPACIICVVSGDVLTSSAELSEGWVWCGGDNVGSCACIYGDNVGGGRCAAKYEGCICDTYHDDEEFIWYDEEGCSWEARYEALSERGRGLNGVVKTPAVRDVCQWMTIG